jgi:hypothetical protein
MVISDAATGTVKCGIWEFFLEHIHA